MTWNPSEESESVTTTLAQPGLGTRGLPAVAESEGDWLCAWCNTRVAHERDRFCIDGKEEITFSNPAGARFEIMTFRETRGCRETGVPTLQHTWFPGHAWSFCQCGECGQHLGWYYLGAQRFAGLIKDRIIRALYIRN